MSAFIVKNKTINNVVSVLSGYEFMVHRIKEEFDIDIKTTKGQTQFAHRLYALNVSSVSSRYGSADDMIGEGFSFEFEHDTGNLEAYKNLQSLMYQCSEGEVVKTLDAKYSRKNQSFFNGIGFA